MWLRDESAMQVDLTTHNEILERCTIDHGGEFVKSTGDGVLAVFDDPVRAVLAACAMRQGLEEADWEGARPIVARMGIHHGWAMRQGADYYGKDVAFTARLHDCANGGQIIVSSAIERRLAEVPGVSLRALGRHRLRNFPEGVEVFQVDDDGHRQSFAPLRTIDAQPGNLHQPTTTILGRTDELEHLAALVHEHRLTTLCLLYTSPSPRDS